MCDKIYTDVGKNVYIYTYIHTSKNVVRTVCDVQSVPGEPIVWCPVYFFACGSHTACTWCASAARTSFFRKVC
jgi:hypothetical protein